MNENYHIGIDLGSQNIKIILINLKENTTPKILVKAIYPSSGISFGYITNKKEINSALKNATDNFYEKYKIEIKEAFVSIDGFGLKSENITIIQSMSNRVINSFDLEKIEEKSKTLLKKKTSDEIIHSEIINYSIDGFEHFDNPEGLSAKKLETDLFFLTCPKNILKTLEEIFENNNILVNAYIPAFLSLSELAVQKIDKKLGTLVIDYGAEKTSLLLIEKNKPINYSVLKIGSKRITEKITLEEKISFSEAESIKKANIKNSKITKIINSELTLLAKEVNKILKKWDKSGILPGGVTLVGNGSKITNIEEIFKKELNLPVKKPINKDLLDFFISYGNVILGKKEKNKEKSIFSLKKIKPLFKIFNTFKL